MIYAIEIIEVKVHFASPLTKTKINKKTFNYRTELRFAHFLSGGGWANPC